MVGAIGAEGKEGIQAERAELDPGTQFQIPGEKTEGHASLRLKPLEQGYHPGFGPYVRRPEANLQMLPVDPERLGTTGLDRGRVVSRAHDQLAHDLGIRLSRKIVVVDRPRGAVDRHQRVHERSPRRSRGGEQGAVDVEENQAPGRGRGPGHEPSSGKGGRSSSRGSPRGATARLS